MAIGMNSGNSTRSVHGGERRPGPEGSLVFPLYQGTVYEVEPGTGYHDLRYIRLNSTPSQVYLHDKLAALDGAEAAVATASGMAATTTVLQTFLNAGDHIIAGACLYGGTHDFLRRAGALGWECTFVDTHRPDTWAAAVTDRTRIFLVETITNPLIRVGRIVEAATFAAGRGILSVVDNTFATPINFRPLQHGFDLSIQSATKYLNGHSDVAAGVVTGRSELVEQVRKMLNLYGATLDPHAGYLLARGMKTLALRVRAHNENASALAAFLADQPAVAEVNHLGLDTHPDHAYAGKLLSGFGGMISVRLHGGAAAAAAMIGALRIPTSAPSLGGVESLVTVPALTSHAEMDPVDRDRLGVTDELVRISCGIEDADDLVEDFEQALAAVGRPPDSAGSGSSGFRTS